RVGRPGVAVLRHRRLVDRRFVAGQHRVPLVRLAAEEPVEVLEAVAGRGPAVERPGRAQLSDRHFVALAEVRRRVAVQPEGLGKRRDVVRPDARPAGQSETREPGSTNRTWFGTQTPGRHSTTRTSVREFRATVRVQVCAVRRCGYGSCVLTVMATEDMSDLAGMSLPVLEDELATLSAHLSAGMCRWLELVGELDRRAAGPSTTAVPRARTGYAKVRALTR